MATRRSAPNIDIAAASRNFADQFRGLNPNDPSVWPAIPRYALCVLVTILVLAALWFVWLTNSHDMLDAERAKEVTLRADYQKKVAQAANLDLLKKQREQVQQYVTLLEKQLPSKAEMDALLKAARASDADVAARSAGASYAGEADPYRKPADEDDVDDEA